MVQFFSEEVSFTLDREKEIIDWIIMVIGEEKLNDGVVNFIFCNDNYLLELNQRFLGRDTLTDVIAFDYSESDEEVSGDVYISVDRTNENAQKFGQAPDKEVLRVIIHGTLHLCGYDDHEADDKLLMTAKEDKYLSLLPF